MAEPQLRGDGSMMILYLLAPLLATVLYVIVLQKAGFRGPILAVSAGPVLSILSFALVGPMALGGPVLAAVLLVNAALSLAPLLVLAFMAWPPVNPPAARTSTENT